MSDALQQFVECVRSDRYIGATYAFCAFGRELTNLACSFVLQVRPVGEDWAVAGNENGLAIRRGWLPIESFVKIISTAQTGELRFDDVTLRLDGNRGQPYDWYGPRDKTRAGVDAVWTSRLFQGQGRCIDEIVGDYQALRMVERRLPSFSPRPFRNWADLSAFLGISSAIEGRRSSTVDVVLPTFARMTSCAVGAHWHVTVGVETQERTDQLSLTITADNSVWQPRRVAASSWRRLGDDTYEAELECPGLEGPAEVQLIALGEVVEEARVGVPALASRAHAALAEADEWLRSLLSIGDRRGRARSDGFESGVVNLMSLAGFPTVHYGHKSRTSFPDLVSEVGDSWLLVGECTTEPPSPEKLQTLTARADLIRARVVAGGKHVSVLRVLFTPCSRAEIAQSVLELAEEELSVAILGSEHLEQLLAMASNGEARSTIVEIILSWVSRFGSIKL